MTRSAPALLLLVACGNDTGIKAYNANPVATISSHVDGDTVDANVPLEFWGSVSDPDHEASDLEATWYQGSAVICPALPPDSDGRTSCEVSLAEGDAPIILEVRDPKGATDAAQVTVTATAEPVVNAPPSCTITAPEDDSRVAPGERVDFAGVVADAEDAADALLVRWTSDVDGTLNEDAADSDGDVAFSTADLSVGRHALTLLVTDSGGETCTDNLTLSVGDGPVVTIDAPTDGATYNEGDLVDFLATIDADGADPTGVRLSWESDLDGLLNTDPADSGGLAAFSEDDLGWGTHEITLTATDDLGLSSDDHITLVINGLPSAPTVSISPDPASPSVDLVASVDTPSEDPEGGAVSYTYAWTRDGAATTYDTDTVPESATEDGERWMVTVTPNDGLGDGPSGTATVTIGNGSPSLADVTLSPDPAYEGDTLTCTPGATTDPDGDSVSLSYAWKVSGTTIAVTSTTLSSSYFDKGDSVVCVVTPTDGLSDGAAVTSNTADIENTAPVVSEVAISPTDPEVGDTLTCGYTFSDADGDADASTVRWTINGTSAGSGTTLTTSYAGGDTITCTVTPDDGEDAGSNVSASVTIGNTAPVLASVTLSPDPAYEGDTLTCTPGSATDADGDSVTYTYAWKVDGTAISRTSSTLSSTYFDRGDAVVCVVTPTDGSSTGSAVTSNTVTIGNTAPEASAVSISPSSPTASSTLTCSYTFSDVDSDSDHSTVSWKINGAIAASGTTLSSGFGGGDSVTCTVTPNDGTDSGTAASKSVTIGNTAPSLASVTLSPDPVYEGDTLTCTPGTATDVDGDSVSYTYAWKVDGASIARTSSTLSSTYFNRDQDVVCVVTPNDGTTSGTAVTSNTAEIENTAPTASAVSISPTSPKASDTLTCSYTYADVDGDTDRSTVTWKLGTTTLGTGTTLSSGYGGGDSVTCSVTPYDGTTSGTAATTSVTIGNTAPTLASVSLTPTTAYEGDTFTCTPGTATDVDGDSVSYTYAWTVEGASVGVTTSTLSSAYFGRGDDVRCSVTPTDGTTAGTAVASSAVTVSNSKPTITALSISPSSPDTDDTLSLSITSSDADGDAITYTYQWKVNSTAVATTSTLSGSSFVRGDTVTVTVTPSDGTDAGSSSAASVTVANAAPSAPTVDITPNYPGAGDDDILCYVVTASTDLDGDTLDYTVTWEGDGLPYPSAFSGTTGPETTSVTDDTIPAADTDLASVWTCTVTPDDGVTEGDTATAEIDVLDMYEAGYATVTSGPGSAAASYMLGPSITVSSATTLYGFGAWLNTSGSYMRMVLYSDSGGSPAALVAYSDIETTTTGDNHLDLSTPVALSAGTYWVMATYSATTYIYYGATTSRTVKYKSAAYSATPTSTFGTASSYSGYPMAYYIRVAD